MYNLTINNLKVIIALVFVVMSLITACASVEQPTAELVTDEAEQATNTATKVPTFTPTTFSEPTIAATLPPTDIPTVTPMQETVLGDTNPDEATQDGTTGAETELATATPEPSATHTPTAAAPSVLLDEELNLRTGPGTNYDRIGSVPAGMTVKVIGRNADTSWWQIAYADVDSGAAWISADYGQAQNTEAVPVVEIPPSPTPAPVVAEASDSPADSTETSASTEPPAGQPDFIVKSVRLWSNEENGGISSGGSVLECGGGHHVYVTVIDPNGNSVDGVVFRDSYDNIRQITGSRGPGRAEFIFWGNGYELEVAEYPSVGRPVTGERSPLVSVKGIEIPIPWLIEGHYCATEAECQERAEKNLLCRGHYSYDIVYQRTW